MPPDDPSCTAPQDLTLAIIGSAGVPANYGGFETLAENLVRFHSAQNLPSKLIVFCSAPHYRALSRTFLSARLQYIGLRANGYQSVLYDAVAMVRAARAGVDTILLLGVSGAIALPLLRILYPIRLVVNIDGLEWRRDKWSPLTRAFLRLSESLAVRHAHVVICDNEVVTDYVRDTYGIKPTTIAYGGDHVHSVPEQPCAGLDLSAPYFFSVCRIEPENNIAMILKAFSRPGAPRLIFLGNWNASAYGRELRSTFSSAPNIVMHDPIYDIGKLRTLRRHMACYVHGHSAGGTNPSLVEAMHFGTPVLAFDCGFNRATTNNEALYFASADELSESAASLDVQRQHATIGKRMEQIAVDRYTWAAIARRYFDILLRRAP